MLKNPLTLKERLARGEVCLGTGICFTGPAITEALCPEFDYVWIDMEHNALSLEAVQGHIMATKGTNATPIVRVPWNDPVLVKPVLDIGAAGIVIPLVRTVADVEKAVASCLYPPEGIRGFGPRRPTNYGRSGGPEFCRQANEDMIVIVQIEHHETISNLDGILAVKGLTAVIVGPNDLAGSMGQMGSPGHPEVAVAIETVVEKCKKAGVPMGIATGDDLEAGKKWLDKGAQWLLAGTDFRHMVSGAEEISRALRAHVGS